MTQPIRRDLEIEEPTNRYFVHPIAARLAAACAGWGVKPNAVSIAGMAFGILAGFAYYHYQERGAVLLGFCLMIAWHVMDGTDGQLARLTNTQSEFGKLLDGICDYVTFIAVYAGLAFAMAGQDGAVVLIVVTVSGACHAVQSAAYEARRQDYVFWAWGRGAAPSSIIQERQPSGLLGVYARLQDFVGGDARFNQAFQTVLAAADPVAAEEIRARYREAFAPAIRHWSILSANYRTLGIFLCAFIHMPLIYFLFEIAGFSLILVILARRQTERSAAFLANL